MPSGPPGPFRRTGLPALLSLSAATTVGAQGTRYDFGTAYSKWGLRCKVSGGATEVGVQLWGTIASSSDANATLVPLTTWLLTANSCDSVVFIADKPVTSILAAVTTLGLSTGASVTAWISACP